MVKSILLATLCTLALTSAQFIDRVPRRLRSALVSKSTPEAQGDKFVIGIDTEYKLEPLPMRILQLSMSMTTSEVSVLNDDASAADDDEVAGGAVDWICQFCPSYLCINCA
jgi:hypothetical protein